MWLAGPKNPSRPSSRSKLPSGRSQWACREANPENYIRINAFDSTKGWETVRMSFIVQRPTAEPGFRLIRQETQGRNLRYPMESYAVGRAPEGARYSA